VLAVTKSRKPPVRYLVSGGIARCGACGGPLRAQVKMSGSRTYYCTPGPDMRGCGKVSIVAAPFEKLVIDAVLVALEGPPLREARSEKGQPVDDVVNEIHELEAELRELAADRGAGRISQAEWLVAREGVAGRLEAAQRLISNRANRFIPDTGGQPLREAWAKLTFLQRRQWIEGVLESVTVLPATKRGPVFDRTRVPIDKFVWRA
jgi:site-specific DNA recombinase